MGNSNNAGLIDVKNSDTGSGLFLATLAVIAACISFGTVPYFAKSLTDAGISSSAIAFYRYILSAIIFAPFLFRRLSHFPIAVWGFCSGIVVGVTWIGYVIAIDMIPVSTAGVIYMSYPVFTLVIGRFLFNNFLGIRSIIAAGLILTAAVIASAPTAIGSDQWLALLLLLATPIGFGFGINILTTKLIELPPLARPGSFCLGAVVGLLPMLWLIDDGTILPADNSDWIMIAGIALFTAVVPQLLYSNFAPKIGAAKTAMAGSAELPTMFLVGALAFGETLTWTQLAAGAIVVLAIALTPARANRNLSNNLINNENQK
jgi:drug/metabolite transporter (DMT)-like permease